MLSFPSALLQGTLHSKSTLSCCWQNYFVKRSAHKRASPNAKPINFTKIKSSNTNEVLYSPVEDDELFAEEESVIEQNKAPRIVKDVWLCSKGFEKALIADLQSSQKQVKTLKVLQ